MRAAVFTAFLACAPLSAPAAEPAWEFAVQVSAQTQTSPPQITLNWLQDTFAVPDSYTVYRKAPHDTAWGVGTPLPGTATSFTDSNVLPGTPYEYQIFKTNSALAYSGYGYICSGIDVPLVERRGKLLLIVDDTHAASLAAELLRLQQDLTGDGWQVLRRDISRQDSPASIKNLIKADYDADPANVRAVFLFGHVPVLRSGNLNVDGHGGRPLPADVFYADMDGAWTDTDGNGVYDQSTLPSDVELEIGRVDFANMPGRLTWNGPPSFPSEVELLRRYLNKDHDFRHARMIVPARALIGDDQGINGRSAPAASGYRNFAPLLGAANIDVADTADTVPPEQRWISVLNVNRYLWAYGCGAGSFTSVSGLGNHTDYYEVWTSDIVGLDAKAVFTMLFGSWFCEWDAEDNIMRAQLAAPSLGLTCGWSGWPHHYYHHMGLGETIGYGIRLTQNNRNILYRNRVNLRARGVHIALMGDPALRMYPVIPPASLNGTAGANGITLDWAASPDATLGYYVYRSPAVKDEFIRVTPSPVSGTSFTDIINDSGTYTYMVRALKRETTPSGTFVNASQGLFVTLTGQGSGPPSVTVYPGEPGPSELCRFNVVRSGNAATALTVFYTVTTTDFAGAEYPQFNSSITIPPGALFADVIIAPEDITNVGQMDTATLTLLADTAYTVSTPASATVSIVQTTPPSAPIIWVDDALPAGAIAEAHNGDAWNWINNNPAPFAGTLSHQSNPIAGLHEHYFYAAADTLSVQTGDTLFAYVYLDPANPPGEVMLQWYDGSWEHRAYWGVNYIGSGPNGPANRFMGPLPPAGQWVRLEVPASAVALEGRTLGGMAFTLYDGRAAWDYAGLERGGSVPVPDDIPPELFLSEPEDGAIVSGAVAVSAQVSDDIGVAGVQFQLDGANLGAEVLSEPFTISWNTTAVPNGSHTLTAIARDTAGNPAAAYPITVFVENAVSTIWIEDSLPAGAVPGASGGDAWAWVSNPAPYSGALAHQSAIASGIHQQYFQGATATLTVNPGDALFVYVHPDPANPPSEIMLQWNDGSWEHRAYWGANNIDWGIDGTASRRFMGPLPPPGQWTRLEVPAYLVGLDGRTLNGMAFTLFGGRATWDYVGAMAGNFPPPDTSPPDVYFMEPEEGAVVSASITVSAEASDDSGVASVQIQLDGVNLGPEMTFDPFAITWDTTAVPNGTHTLTAVARDFAGNQAVSAPVTVTVDNGTAVATVWIDDVLPTGATPGASGGDAWTWVNDPAPYSGASAHQSAALPGLHQHYFSGATATLAVNPGDTLFAYVYLDPANPPTEIMLQWNDGSWEHRAYWGANNIDWGINGTASRRFMGALPPPGQWTRLEVPASAVGLESRTLNGMAFTLYDGRATWDFVGATNDNPPPPDSAPPAVALTAPANNATVAGTIVISADASDNVAVAGVQFKLNGGDLGVELASAPYTMNWNTAAVPNGTYTLTAVARDAAGNQATSSPATVNVNNETTVTTIWVDDSLPAGAIADTSGGDMWTWTSSNPAPNTGALAHSSANVPGLHQHFFHSATDTLTVNPGDVLFVYVHLDPANPPAEIMLQWNDGSWEHRAYWGANAIEWGADGTASRRYMGPLPPAGLWTRLEVPASAVGLENAALNGLAFTLFGGRVTWDTAGKSTP
ncbi:MAG: Ig-like domain-containing protein [Verrucomicrobiota bacterium]